MQLFLRHYLISSGAIISTRINLFILQNKASCSVLLKAKSVAWSGLDEAQSSKKALHENDTMGDGNEERINVKHVVTVAKASKSGIYTRFCRLQLLTWLVDSDV